VGSKALPDPAQLHACVAPLRTGWKINNATPAQPRPASPFICGPADARAPRKAPPKGSQKRCRINEPESRVSAAAMAASGGPGGGSALPGKAGRKGSGAGRGRRAYASAGFFSGTTGRETSSLRATRGAASSLARCSTRQARRRVCACLPDATTQGPAVLLPLVRAGHAALWIRL